MPGRRSSRSRRTLSPSRYSRTRVTGAGGECKDCLALPLDEQPRRKRAAPYPGPRCWSHHQAITRGRSAARKAAYVEKTYSITEDQYQALYRAQGGTCAICQRATGRTKRLAVDHDHACCDGPVSCGRCVRGLLCKKCNRDVLGHLRDDPAALVRGAEYLRNPPARRVFGA